jgi:hypothetical protein
LPVVHVPDAESESMSVRIPVKPAHLSIAGSVAEGDGQQLSEVAIRDRLPERIAQLFSTTKPSSARVRATRDGGLRRTRRESVDHSAQRGVRAAG